LDCGSPLPLSVTVTKNVFWKIDSHGMMRGMKRSISKAGRLRVIKSMGANVNVNQAIAATRKDRLRQLSQPAASYRRAGQKIPLEK
jgi:hypothetical protein